jgi:predicted RNA-binding protein with PUA-like domain
MNYFLLKSEPNCFSIDDLAKKGTESWTGVRNFQARNILRDDMRVGDLCFFYHSTCEVPGIVGLMRVVSDALPDMTALDVQDEHYDPKSSLLNTIWITRNMDFVEKFQNPITLSELKSDPELSGMEVTRRGSRLSVTKVSEEHFNHILNTYKNTKDKI